MAQHNAKEAEKLAEKLEKCEAGRKKLRQAISILNEKLQATENVLEVNETLRQECEKERQQVEIEKQKAEQERKLRQSAEQDTSTLKEQLVNVITRLEDVENHQKFDSKERDCLRSEVNAAVEGVRAAAKAVDVSKTSLENFEKSFLSKMKELSLALSKANTTSQAAQSMAKEAQMVAKAAQSLADASKQEMGALTVCVTALQKQFTDCEPKCIPKKEDNSLKPETEMQRQITSLSVDLQKDMLKKVSEQQETEMQRQIASLSTDLENHMLKRVFEQQGMEIQRQIASLSSDLQKDMLKVVFEQQETEMQRHITSLSANLEKQMLKKVFEQQGTEIRRQITSLSSDLQKDMLKVVFEQQETEMQRHITSLSANLEKQMLKKVFEQQGTEIQRQITSLSSDLQKDMLKKMLEQQEAEMPGHITSLSANFEKHILKKVFEQQGTEIQRQITSLSSNLKKHLLKKVFEKQRTEMQRHITALSADLEKCMLKKMFEQQGLEIQRQITSLSSDLENHMLKKVFEQQETEIRKQIASLSADMEKYILKRLFEQEEAERPKNNASLSSNLEKRILGKALEKQFIALQDLEKRILQKMVALIEQKQEALKSGSMPQALEREKGSKPQCDIPEKVVNKISRLVSKEKSTHLKIEKQLLALTSLLQSGGREKRERNGDDPVGIAMKRRKIDEGKACRSHDLQSCNPIQLTCRGIETERGNKLAYSLERNSELDIIPCSNGDSKIGNVTYGKGHLKWPLENGSHEEMGVPMQNNGIAPSFYQNGSELHLPDADSEFDLDLSEDERIGSWWIGNTLLLSPTLPVVPLPNKNLPLQSEPLCETMIDRTSTENLNKVAGISTRLPITESILPKESTSAPACEISNEHGTCSVVLIGGGCFKSMDHHDVANDMALVSELTSKLCKHLQDSFSREAELHSEGASDLIKISFGLPREYLACGLISGIAALGREVQQMPPPEAAYLDKCLRVSSDFVTKVFVGEDNWVLFDCMVQHLTRFLIEGTLQLLTCSKGASDSIKRGEYSLVSSVASIEAIQVGSKVLAVLCKALSSVSRLQAVVYEILHYSCDKDAPWLLTIFSSFSSMCGRASFVSDPYDLLGHSICVIISELIANVEMGRVDDWKCLGQSVRSDDKLDLESFTLFLLDLLQHILHIYPCVKGESNPLTTSLEISYNREGTHSLLFNKAKLSVFRSYKKDIPPLSENGVNGLGEGLLMSVETWKEIVHSEAGWKGCYLNVLSSLELIASFMGWDWTYNELIVKYFFTLITQAPNLITMAGVVHFFGICGRLALDKNDNELPGLEDLRKTLLFILNKKVSSGGHHFSFLVQAAAAQSLLELSLPFSRAKAAGHCSVYISHIWNWFESLDKPNQDLLPKQMRESLVSSLQT